MEAVRRGNSPSATFCPNMGGICSACRCIDRKLRVTRLSRSQRSVASTLGCRARWRSLTGCCRLHDRWEHLSTLCAAALTRPPPVEGNLQLQLWSGGGCTLWLIHVQLYISLTRQNTPPQLFANSVFFHAHEVYAWGTLKDAAYLFIGSAFRPHQGLAGSTEGCAPTWSQASRAFNGFVETSLSD